MIWLPLTTVGRKASTLIWYYIHENTYTSELGAVEWNSHVALRGENGSIFLARNQCLGQTSQNSILLLHIFPYNWLLQELEKLQGCWPGQNGSENGSVLPRTCHTEMGTQAPPLVFADDWELMSTFMELSCEAKSQGPSPSCQIIADL